LNSAFSILDARRAFKINRIIRFCSGRNVRLPVLNVNEASPPELTFPNTQHSPHPNAKLVGNKSHTNTPAQHGANGANLLGVGLLKVSIGIGMGPLIGIQKGPL
jgi:hypothetical protein